MVASLGSPINSSLQFQQGGNPIAGLAGGGLAGLGQAYQQSYNSYLSTNQQLYDQINAGYGTVLNNIGNTLGQGGTGYGVAQGAADQITEEGNQAASGGIQNSINSGVGKSTAAVAAQRGYLSTTQQSLKGLGLGLANEYAGYEANLGQSQLNFMNSLNAPPPNAAAYSQLAQQYGQQQQFAATNALQQQALQYQQQSSRIAAGRSAAGGAGGGVSTPQMPRGGTYGSGGGGMPSGNATAPKAYNPQQVAPVGIGSLTGPGNQVLNMGGLSSGGINPPGESDLESSLQQQYGDPYGSIGDYGAGFGGDFGGYV